MMHQVGYKNAMDLTVEINLVFEKNVFNCVDFIECRSFWHVPVE